MDVNKVCDIAGELNEYLNKKYKPTAAEQLAIFSMACNISLAAASKL